MAKRPILSESEVAAIVDAFHARKPSAMTESDLEDSLQIDSFSVAPTTFGAAIRFKFKSGETQDTVIASATARILIHHLITSGVEAGWMDEDGALQSVVAQLDS